MVETEENVIAILRNNISNQNTSCPEAESERTTTDCQAKLTKQSKVKTNELNF